MDGPIVYRKGKFVDLCLMDLEELSHFILEEEQENYCRTAIRISRGDDNKAYTPFGFVLDYLVQFLSDKESVLFLHNFLFELRSTVNDEDYENILNFAHCADGNTALHFCIANGFLESAKYLIYKRADIQKPNQKGLTPLDFAVLYEEVNMFLFLKLMGGEYYAGEIWRHLDYTHPIFRTVLSNTGPFYLIGDMLLKLD